MKINNQSKIENEYENERFNVIGGDNLLNSFNENSKEGNININFQINNLKANLEREYNIKNEELNKKSNQISIREEGLKNRESMPEIKSQEFINDKNQNEILKNKNDKLIIQNRELEEQLRQKKEQLSQSNDNMNERKKVLLGSVYQPEEIINFIDIRKQNQEKDNVDEGKKVLLSSVYQAEEINNFIDQSRENQNEIQIKNLNEDTQEMNPMPLRPKIHPLQAYKEPTLIGLNNIRDTCYINSILQCLNQIPSLTNYFLNDLNQEVILNNKNFSQLSPSYLQLTRMLWDKNKRGSSFSPDNFMEAVGKINPLFKNGKKSDYKDFIIFIIDRIHTELKRPIKFQRYSASLNQYDRENAFLNFMNKFQKECSIISDIFFGITETKNVCLYCKNVYSSQEKDYPKCYNYEIFNCLVFPLEEVRNFRNKNNSVSLDDCFFYNQKTERFNGENKNYCNICKKLYDSEYTSSIYSSPNVLVLILKRAKDNIYDIKLDFSEILDITQFVLEKDIPQLIYNLIGVVTQVEQRGPNEHYIGFCKSPINNLWYSYNDAFVNLVEDVQKEIINFGVPIILFYQKSN